MIQIREKDLGLPVSKIFYIHMKGHVIKLIPMFQLGVPTDIFNNIIKTQNFNIKNVFKKLRHDFFEVLVLILYG